MKTLISLLSVFAALSGFSQVYTTPEVVTNIARGEAFSILGSITNGGGGTTNIIIVTNVLPSNLITQYYNGAYLTGTFSGVFRGNGAALSNVQPASANLTNWSMLSTNILAGVSRFNPTQFNTNGQVSIARNAAVTNLYNFGTLLQSSTNLNGPYVLFNPDGENTDNHEFTINLQNSFSSAHLGNSFGSAHLGGILTFAYNYFQVDFSGQGFGNDYYQLSPGGGFFSYPPAIGVDQVFIQPPKNQDLITKKWVDYQLLGYRSAPTNLAPDVSDNALLMSRSGTNYWSFDGSSLTNIHVDLTNLANIVTNKSTGLTLAGALSSSGTYPLILTNSAISEGLILGIGSTGTTNHAARWDSGNRQLIITNATVTGTFTGVGSGLTGIQTDVRLVENAVSLFSPSVKAAFKQPPVVTPNIRNPYTNALMGWFSWNNNQCPDQWYWTNMIGKMVSLGLRDAGYTAVCFDAPWQEGRDVNGYPLWNTNRFPNGIAYCSAYARSNGLKFFMWTPASQYTNNIVYANCTTNWQGAGGYAAQDAHFMATNFVEGVVLDNFWSSSFDTNLQAFVAAMETHVATNGRPVYYKTIGYGSWFPPFATNMHAMRVATDITTNWSDIAKQFNAWDDAADHVGPGGCLPDMDMLEIGNGLVSSDADIAHFSIWAVSGTPLMLGMNLTNMATYVRQTITNANLIRIHQDPGQYPGRIVKRTRVPGGTQDIWLKPLGWPGSGTNVVLLVNNSTNTGYIPFRMSELGLGTNNWVRCITPFVEQDHGIVLDYFRYKNFVTAYQSRCYLIVSDPSSNNVIGTFKDYLVNGGDNVTLSGTFAGGGSGVSNVIAQTLITGATVTNLDMYGLIYVGGASFAQYDTNRLMTSLASTYSASIFGNNAWLTNLYPTRIHGSPDGLGGYKFDVDSSGNVIGRTFTGDGSGLTNIIAVSTNPIPAYVVTNNQQNVSLGGTFTGNGSGLTGYNEILALTNGVLFTNTMVIGNGGRNSTTNPPFPVDPLAFELSGEYAGQQNTLFGKDAGLKITSGNGLTYIGHGAGRESTNASQNTFVGWYAGYVNTWGYHNSYYGVGAGQHAETNVYAVAVGTDSGLTATNFSYGTLVGSSISMATGLRDVVIGYNSGTGLSGDDNVAVGANSGGFRGSRNVAIGSYCAPALTGSNNVLMGFNAGVATPTLSSSVGIGYGVFGANKSGGSVAVGSLALNQATNAANDVAVGREVMLGTFNSSYNVAIGYRSLMSAVTASDTVAIGRQALNEASASAGNTVVGGYAANFGSATETALFGYQAFFYGAGTGNSAFGYQAGAFTTNTASRYNCFFGDQSGPVVGAGIISNSIAIGYKAAPTNRNQTVIGNVNTTQALIFGAIETPKAVMASNFVATVVDVETPAFKSSVTNNFILKADDGGTWILRVGNDGTLTTVTNTSGL